MTTYRIISDGDPVGEPNYRYFIQRKFLWMWIDVRHVDESRTVGDGVPLSRLTWFETYSEAEAWIMKRGTMPKRRVAMMEFLR